jgi:hypothetical protein
MLGGGNIDFSVNVAGEVGQVLVLSESLGRVLPASRTTREIRLPESEDSMNVANVKNRTCED